MQRAISRLSSRRAHVSALVSVVLLLTAPFAAVTHAQYFGQNKVQYEQFDFEVLRTDHFDVYFYPEERRAITLAARMAERWNARLTELLNHELSGRQPLIMYAAPSDFQQTNVTSGVIGEGTGGFTEPLKRRIVLPFAGPIADTDHVIGHELVHAFQYDIAAERSQGNRRPAGINQLPLWFIEGMAEYLSIGPRSRLTAMWMRDAIAQEKLPEIGDLDNPRYFPYRWGHAVWAYVAGRWGDGVIRQLLAQAIDTGSADEAFKAVLGLSEKELSAEWLAALRQTFTRDLAKASTASGRPILAEGGLGDDLNVAPALSPDGRRVAFLSTRSLFSVDLYVADIDAGKVVRQLTSTAVNPHFESLQFISSAGAWDASGQHLAVAAVSSGKPVLAIYDVGSGRRTREVALSGVDEALNPAWSPDGTRIAFVGLSGGLTDLFLVSLADGTMTRLTDDAFAELHPSWSPDGTRLALATDRFSTELPDIASGSLQLATLDVSSRAMQVVRALPRGKHINPQWSADGASLYFIGDPSGINNVYRVRLDGSGVSQVTDVATGISGITESSPALSAAAGRLAFTVFEDGDYRLRTTEERSVKPATWRADEADAALLPPVARRDATLTRLLSSPTAGLPAAPAQLATEPYRPRLQLDAVGQPTVAVGADRFGAFGGGGVSFYMSDMLGDHNLAAAFQSVSTLDGEFSANDLGGALVYQNTRRRWNWAVAVDQTPYRTGFVSETAGTVDGEPALVQQTVISRQADRGLTGIVSYPFSRAQRVEVSAAYRQLRFDDRLHTAAFSLITGELLAETREDLPSIEGLNLGQTSAALVYDTASFGATSPVLGQRYRAEISPLFGSLRYTGVLLDYRRYVQPARLYTIAGRVLHYGRYGGDAEDSRLFPLFVGYPSLVRGYDVGTFDADECPPTPDGRCESFDRLVGSRMLVANLEFRFPLLRPFGLNERVYGPLPAEVALFADGGVAWSRGERPSVFGGDRKGVSSVGLALRVNALGFAVAQLDLARPLQRPGRGWIFQFSLAPGF